MAGFRGLRGAAAALAVLGLTGTGAAAQSEQVRVFAEGGALPHVVWAESFGAVDAVSDEVDAISIDPEGNTVVSGIFRGAFDIAGETLRSRGAGDIFIASFSPEGALRWLRHAGSPGEDNTFDLTTDGAGDIYLSGWFSGTIELGDVALTSRGKADMFVARLAPDGATRWARSFGGPENDGGNELFVLESGEIVVAAVTQGDFAVGDETFRFGGGLADSLAIRMDADGEVLWTTPFGGGGSAWMRSVAMNDAEEVFVGFQFDGELQVGARRYESVGGFDGLAVKLDRAGAPVWARQVGGAGLDNVRGLAPAPGGAVYAAGRIAGAVDLFGLEIPAIGRRGDDYLVRMSGDGAMAWIVTAAGPGRGRGWEIVSDPKGVIVSGLLEDRLTVRRNTEVLAELDAPLGRPTSLLAGLSEDGRLRFAVSPLPGGDGAGGFGADLAVARDGSRAAQVVMYRGGMSLAGRAFDTEAEFDPIVLHLTLNGR